MGANESMPYWARSARIRTTRRRAIAGGAALLGGATLAATVGCSSGSAGEEKNVSSLLYRPVDTSSKAVKGGNLPLSVPRSPNTLDIHKAAGPYTAMQLYSRLVKF